MLAQQRTEAVDRVGDAVAAQSPPIRCPEHVPSTPRAVPEPFPSRSRALPERCRDIEFLTVTAGFGRAPCQGGAFQILWGDRRGSVKVPLLNRELNGDRDVDLSTDRACRPGRDCHAFCRV